MKTIPIYDDTAPIACTADTAEIGKRIEQIERLRTSVDRIERAEHGVLLHFPNRPEVEADLRQFVVDEKGCCQFWGFEITSTAESLTLRWDAPPSLDGFMARLVDAFEGDEPISAASGVL